jgi:hypothetical protein
MAIALNRLLGRTLTDEEAGSTGYRDHLVNVQSANLQVYKSNVHAIMPHT